MKLLAQKYAQLYKGLNILKCDKPVISVHVKLIWHNWPDDGHKK